MENTLNYLLALTPEQFEQFITLSGYAGTYAFITGKESKKNYCVIKNTDISMPLGSKSEKPKDQDDFYSNYFINVVTADMTATSVPPEVFPYLGHSIKNQVTDGGTTKVVTINHPKAMGFFLLITRKSDNPLVTEIERRK